jgi:hypothetical protein
MSDTSDSIFHIPSLVLGGWFALHGGRAGRDGSEGKAAEDYQMGVIPVGIVGWV